MDPLLLMTPWALLLGRVSGFVAVLPIFGATSVPVIARAGIAIVLTAFFGIVTPPRFMLVGSYGQAGLLLAGEIVIGLGLGLTINLVFLAVQQGGRIIGILLGLADAGIIDPVNGEEADPAGLILETIFALLFLAARGHELLLRVIGGSMKAFPLGGAVNIAALTEAVVSAGSAMLEFALRLAGPMVAAFFLLAVVLAVLARVMPDMNILFESYPLRLGLGMLMALAILPSFTRFVEDLSGWMKVIVTG